MWKISIALLSHLLRSISSTKLAALFLRAYIVILPNRPALNLAFPHHYNFAPLPPMEASSLNIYTGNYSIVPSRLLYTFSLLRRQPQQMMTIPTDDHIYSPQSEQMLKRTKVAPTKGRKTGVFSCDLCEGQRY